MSGYDVLLVTIDSLRRDFLGAYRDRPHVLDYAVETPNLDRFAERASVFENHYAGSLPCMPQRREFMCGTQEFLWRPWGPVEPFDRTVPALAAEAGATTGLVTDHYHYFEHGSHDYYDDPTQERNLADERPDERARLRGHLVDALDRLDAPTEQYERLGFAG